MVDLLQNPALLLYDLKVRIVNQQQKQKRKSHLKLQKVWMIPIMLWSLIQQKTNPDTTTTAKEETTTKTATQKETQIATDKDGWITKWY